MSRPKQLRSDDVSGLEDPEATADALEAETETTLELREEQLISRMAGRLRSAWRRCASAIAARASSQSTASS